MRQINTFAKSRPPIFIVGTHRDQRSESHVMPILSAIEAKYRQNWSGNVRGVFGVSLAKRTGLDDLKRLILESATKLLSSLEVPAYYLALKQVLHELQRESSDYVKFVAFESRVRTVLAQTGCIKDSNFADELRTALSFFNDSGIILYFNTSELRDLIILHPKWLADILST